MRIWTKFWQKIVSSPPPPPADEALEGSFNPSPDMLKIDGHGSESQPQGILPSARVGGSFETLRGEDSPHRPEWGPDRGARIFSMKTAV